MKVVYTTLLCLIGWLSATLTIYHEPSVKEFGNKITTNKISFGYSVTYTKNNKRLIVSAPKASDHGALFSCDINGTDCDSIPINTNEIEAPKGYNIWLGASVRAGSNFFMTCAPRYRQQISNSGIFLSKVKTLSVTPSRCYKYSSSGTFKPRLIRLPSVPQSYFANSFERMMLSLGWSMDIDENDNAVIGGPAMSTGHAVKYDHSIIGSKKQPVLITPGKKEAPFLKTNFGYSVVHRKYNSVMQIAISSTYGEHGYGMVVLYNSNDNAVIGKIRGIQVGAMFGASLCAASVDSKGQALLLVGAPTYTSDDKYNTGAVFVYKDEKYNIYNTIKGTSDGGQFGYALANLGDLNGDDKDEIAISAPYEDEGQGAVYIYSGAQLLDRDKEVTWLQRIQRAEYRSFGLSLYAVPDHDKNGCKELAIGIPQNNTAVLFSCLPTITATVRQLKPKGKINETSGFSSILFESCLDFHYPELPESISANFSVGLDIPNVLIKLPATGQSSNDAISYNVHISSKKKEYCENLIISVPMDKTYDPTLYYQISAVMLNDPKNMVTFDPFRVTVSDLSKLSLPGTTWIGECADGNKCVPQLDVDLTLSVTSYPYVVGSTDVETVRISVKNTGDPAYEACVRVFLYGVNPSSWPPSCIHPYTDVNANETLICSPIRLLRNNTSWDIEEIKLDMRTMKSKEEGGHGNVDVKVHLYEECNTRGAVKTINKTIQTLWDSEHITVLGLIKQGGVINITRNEIEYSSKQIQHEYEISNNGPTTWRNVKVSISLPKEMYLGGTAPPSGTFYECSPGATDKEFISYCVITTLKKNTKFVIVQPIDIKPDAYGMLKKQKHLKIESYLRMLLDEDEKVASAITTLHLNEVDVPTWIIIVAVLFGLILIAIVVFILYKNGFLRRKKKDDLTRLRINVQRQSMRRTTIIEHNVDNSDRKKLIESTDEAKPDASTSTQEVDVRTQKENKNKLASTDEKYSAIDQDIEKPVYNINTKEKTAAENRVEPGETNKKDEDTKTDRKSSVKTKKTDPIAGVIIDGLQKNIRQ